LGGAHAFEITLSMAASVSGSQYENENRSHLAAAAASRSAGNRAADDTDYPDVLSISVIRVIRGFVRAVRI
jgi:hypothetical protein